MAAKWADAALQVVAFTSVEPAPTYLSPRLPDKWAYLL